MRELTTTAPATAPSAERETRGSALARAPSKLKDLIGIRGKLLASYLSATVVLLVGLASFGQMQLAEDTAARAAARRQIMRVTLEIQNAILDAETAQRGFLLTGDERYLQEPEAGPLPPPLEHQLDELTRLAASYPIQAKLATRIAANARIKLAEIHDTVTALRSGLNPLPIFEQARGEEVTEAIRADASLLFEEVRAMREAESRRADMLARFAKWFIVVGNAVAFLLAAAVTYWIGKAMAQAEAASAHLARYSKQLEDHANRLAAQEQLLEQRLAQERQLTRNLEHSNRALARSNADLEQFAYVASHDLRAPLRGIASLSDWLEEDLGTTTPAVKKHIDTLRGRVRRLDALITGIATYSRAGRKEEALEVLDIGHVVREVIDLAVPPGKVRVHIGAELPVMFAPRTPLQQIFLNLVSNAVKHGAADGGELWVECADEGDVWRFSVRDQGPGIAPEYHDKIFSLFQRLKSRDQVEGTGIGLALVKKLVERYGGRVWVESAPGKGARFSFTWPKRLSIE